jgi:RNA polymerase sigma-70 factor (ECF subfamily)
MDVEGPLEREIAGLYRAYAAGLLRYGMVVVQDQGAVQDGVQEVFLRYFTARTEGREIENPRAWLYRVMRNYLLDARRAAESNREVGLDDTPDRVDERADPEASIARTQELNQLSRALAPRELECVRLRAEGLQYDEIARVLDLRPGTVAALLARAHRKFRKLRGERERSKLRSVEGSEYAP